MWMSADNGPRQGLDKFLKAASDDPGTVICRTTRFTSSIWMAQNEEIPYFCLPADESRHSTILLQVRLHPICPTFCPSTAHAVTVHMGICLTNVLNLVDAWTTQRALQTWLWGTRGCQDRRVCP